MKTSPNDSEIIGKMFAIREIDDHVEYGFLS